MRPSILTALFSAFFLTTNGFATIEAIDVKPGKPFVDPPGKPQPNAGCGSISASKNGRYVAFLSGATNLVKGLHPNKTQAYRTDRVTNTTICISLAKNHAPANDDVLDVSLSGNGRYAVIVTRASNLGTPFNGFVQAIFEDLKTGKRLTASLAAFQPYLNLDCDRAFISGDGSTVVFETAASNVLAVGNNGKKQLYAWDRFSNDVDALSFSPQGQPGNADTHGSSGVGISKDGKFVTFASDATNLVSANPGNPSYLDVFVRDRAVGTTELISRNFSGGAANKASTHPSISEDGRYVGYVSTASNITTDDNDGNDYDCFFYDRQLNLSSRIDGYNDGDALMTLLSTTISADGRYLFALGTKMHPTDSNLHIQNARRYDRLTGETVVYQVAAPLFVQQYDWFYEIAISGNAKKLFFVSASPILPKASDTYQIYATKL